MQAMEREFFVDGGKRRLTYLEWGNTKSTKTVFCVHGITRTAHDFDYLAEFLCDEYRVIAINLAGHGTSDYLDNYRLYHYSIFLSDILQLFSQQNLHSTYWIGSSLGGIIGIYAAQEPNIISKLILNDVGPQFPATSFSAMQQVDIEQLRPMYTFASYDACKNQCSRLMAGFKFPKPEHFEHAIRYGCIQSRNGAYKLNFDVGLFSLFQNTDNVMRKDGIWHLWHTINIPILELWGAMSPLVTASLIETMRSTNPNLTVCKCLRNGHVCNLIDTEQLEFIKSWLAANTKIPDTVLDC